MLSQLDFMAFEQERTMPYQFSPYPEPKDPQEILIEEAREKLVQLKAYIHQNDCA